MNSFIFDAMGFVFLIMLIELAIGIFVYGLITLRSYSDSVAAEKAAHKAQMLKYKELAERNGLEWPYE